MYYSTSSSKGVLENLINTYMTQPSTISRIWHGLWNHSTVPLQSALAFGSLLWAVFLFWEGDTFERPVYQLMGSFFNEEIWGTLYLTHAVLLLMQLCKPTEFPCWFKVVIASFGCALWTTTHITMFVFPLPASITPGIVLSVASWWVLVRTETWRPRRSTDL